MSNATTASGLPAVYFEFEGNLCRTLRRGSESQVDAVARSMVRRVGANVELAFSDREHGVSETYTARYFADDQYHADPVTLIL